MTSSFCELPKYVFENVIEDVKQNFDFETLKNAINSTTGKRYNLVITGSIGAGKSTISQILTLVLKNYCNVIMYPEYISINYKNRPIGNDIFDMYMDKKITASTFQNFVIDIWKLIFEENGYNNVRDNMVINIFERLPHDAVFCFTKEQVGKKITNEEYETILTKYYNLEKTGIPTYNDCCLKKISNDSKIYKTIVEILKVICDDIKNNSNITRVIGLTVSEDKFMHRIIQRGRESEENYDLDILTHYNNYYTDLYENIESK